MEKNIKLVVGGVLLLGGLVVASKTDNKNISIVAKDEWGNKTMSLIVATIGAVLIYKSIK
jgi:hypothetical protein